MPMPKKKQANDFVKYSSMAFQMGIIILGSTYGGVRLDKYLQWKFPVFTVVFAISSVGIALYQVLKGLSNSNKK